MKHCGEPELRLSLSEYEKAVRLWRKERIEGKAHGCQTI